MAKNINIDNYLVKDGGDIYQIEPSAFNFPVSQTVGDTQISLDMSELIIDTTKVDCNVRSCKAFCNVP